MFDGFPIKFKDFEASLGCHPYYSSSKENLHEKSDLHRSFDTRINHAEPKTNWVDELSKYPSKR